VMSAAARAGAPQVTEDMSRFIRYGRGVDTTRMESELRFVPRLTTAELVDSLARDSRRAGSLTSRSDRGGGGPAEVPIA
jgi:hypothetical protein